METIEYFNEQKVDSGDGMLSNCFGGDEEGWRKALRVLGVFSAIIGIFASSVMRLPLPLEVELHEHPNPDDDKNDGKKGGKITEFFSCEAMPQFDGDFKPLFVVGRRVRISFFYGEMLWRL